MVWHLYFENHKEERMLRNILHGVWHLLLKKLKWTTFEKVEGTNI
jgi:hypothetical protein